MMETLAQYWIEHNSAIWRKARKTHKCGGELYEDGLEVRHEDGSLVKCDREILIGDQYLNTYENIGSPFDTLKLCERCANQLTQEL